ncbi:recombinase family protein [Arthrobacter sp. U41]|uniref:recombinase family protein n=1 Tax=Arthrobacter sp. U41 TaxID=1849032 RepID=UPI00085940E2|nr:hypothetical protein ASPU41_02110 [Arthrobacter sp. U41]
MKRLLEYAEEGDTVVVRRVHRLSRSLIDVLSTGPCCSTAASMSGPSPTASTRRGCLVCEALTVEANGLAHTTAWCRETLPLWPRIYGKPGDG